MSSDGKAELQKYLDAHELQGTLNGMLNELCAKRPPKPLDYLATQLEEKKSTTESAVADAVLVMSADAAADATRLAQQWQMSYVLRGGSVSAKPEPFGAPPPFSDNTVVLYLVRHGARHDYANQTEWREACAKDSSLEPTDPPLSELGQQQARDVAKALAKEPISQILCSPYQRCLQTAQPLAKALDLRIGVENALAEFHHCPTAIAPAAARVKAFPEVQTSYHPMLTEHRTATEADGVQREPVVDYLRRILLLSKQLPRKHAGHAIACYSHAASVSLVAALSRCSQLVDAGRFAPCGIWKLRTDDGGCTWRVEAKGDDNSGHTSQNDPSTYPWGFEHIKKADDCHQSDWEKALNRGPWGPSVDGWK